MNYFELHIGDLTEATAHLSILEDGAYGRLLRKYYATEKPLPADVKQVQRLIGARSKDERDAVQAVLEEFFELQDDGWHQSRCDAEIAAYHEKQVGKEGKRENAKERQRRARERRAHLFEFLRGHAIVPAWTTTTAELETLASRVTGDGESRPVTQPVTRDDTASQTPVPRHQTPEEGDKPPLVTARGRLSLAFKAVGIMPEPGHGDFQALADSGAEWAEFEPHVPKALTTDRPFRYAVAAVVGERKRAARRGPLPPAAQAVESTYAREQRERAEAFAPSVARRAPQPSPRGDVIEAEVTDVTPRSLG